MTPPERGPAPAERMTVAIVGDLITTRPIAPIVASDARSAAAVERLRAADVAVGNLEFAAADPDDPDAWVWSVPNDWSIATEPAAVGDLRDLGFGVVGRANNHAMDRGPAGMRTTSLLLDEASIDHAGAGEDLSRASAPSYHETARGRLGIVSVTTSPSPPDVAGALDAFAGLAPRPGIHALDVHPVVTVPPAAHEVLQAVHDRVPDAAGEWMNGDPSLRVFSATFERGDEVAVRYDVDPEGRARLLRSVRQAAHHADVVVMTVHAHQGDTDPATPPTFLRELARDAIASGADAVAISGPHVLAPVELVDGRPVFYGLGDFIWSDLGGPLPAYMWSATRAVAGDDIDPATMTEAELVMRLNDDGFADPWVFRAVQAELVVGPAGVERVRVHPVDLGQHEPITRRGVPRVPETSVAAEILERVKSMSAPLGTVIDIDGGVGTIRSEETVPAG
jgi:poly-gamma-glutamate capsule biosynthesis protein CapA/YwtB (metallophosphatase superfamily)